VTEPVFKKIQAYFVLIFAIFGLVYSLSNFNQNPAVITVVSLILACIIWISGYNEIEVYPDGLAFVYRRSIYLCTGRRFTPYSDIKSIRIKTPLKRKDYFLSEVVEIFIKGNPFWNTIEIVLLNGKSRAIRTKIAKDGMDRVSRAINQVAPGLVE
jgi:hypothetical protein